MIHPEAKKLLPARSVMLGVHRSSCSYGPTSMTAGAPRWCAISRPGATLGSLELWVMNATKAYANPASVMCSGAGNADCIKLTSNLFSSQPDAGPVYPTAHRFYGDTLIYYANAMSAPSELYKGPVFAWKPGWTAGKQVASNNAVLCSGHSRADVAVCIENISPEGVMPVTWDIHAGTLEGGPMKKVATITPVHPTTEASQWGSGFTTMGDYFVFSTPNMATGNRETLFFIKTADIAGGTVMPTQVGTPGVSRWTLNAAGTKWFYLRDYNYNREGEPSGTLYMADFPTGANEVKIQSTGATPLIPGGTTRGVGTYQVLVGPDDLDKGLGLLVNVVGGRGNYRIMNNPAASPDDPANVISVVNDIATLPIYSPDLRFNYFAKAVDEMVGTTDSWVIKSDGMGSCTLTQTLASSIFGFPFLENAGLVFWMDNFDAATDSGEGWLANPDGCPAASKKKFSNAIDFWFVDGDKGMLYSDDSDGQRVSLRYAPYMGGTLATTPTPIQRQIDRMFAIQPNYEGVMFSITSSNQSVDGVYYLKLPVGSTPAADGGVSDAAGQ